jgi:hypothetical protein
MSAALNLLLIFVFWCRSHFNFLSFDEVIEVLLIKKKKIFSLKLNIKKQNQDVTNDNRGLKK